VDKFQCQLVEKISLLFRNDIIKQHDHFPRTTCYLERQYPCRRRQHLARTPKKTIEYNYIISQKSRNIKNPVLYLMGEDCSNIAHGVMYHKSQDTHLCSTSLVKFQCSFLGLPFCTLGVPSKIKISVAEISSEFTVSGLVSVGHFHENPCQDHLADDGVGEGTPGCPSSRDFLKTRETDTSYRVEQKSRRMCNGDWTL
jgi:hypothetical protein